MARTHPLSFCLALLLSVALASHASAQRGPAEWDETRPYKLGSELAGYIKDGNAAQKAALSSYAVTRFEDEASRDVLNHHWVRFIRSVKGSLTQAEKDAWVQRIDASVPEAGNDLKNHPVQDLYATIQLQLELGNEQAPRLWLDWWATEPTWNEGSIIELSALATGLASVGPDGHAALVVVAEHVVENILNDADKVQEGGMPQWGRLGEAIRDHIPAQKLIEARETLRASALDGIAERNVSQMMRLNVARGSVFQEKDTRSMWADWVAAGNPVTDLTPNYWGYTMSVLARGGESTVAVREAMVLQILERIQADATSFNDLMWIRNAGSANWREIASAMPGELPEEQRLAALEKVNQVIAAQAPIGFDRDKAMRSESLLRFLGAENVALMSDWAAAGSWKQWKLAGFKNLVGQFSRMGELGTAYKQALAQLLLEERITDPEKIREGSVSDWRWMTSRMDNQFRLCLKTPYPTAFLR